MSGVWWRGVLVDERTRDMLEELAALSGPILLQPSQGSWSSASASAGTHSGCGAADLMNNTPAEMDTIVGLARSIGFAAWHRTPAQSSWPHHVHLIAVQPGGKHDRGCLSSAAHDQVVDYYEGRNGLAGNGPDDATRAHVGTVWEDCTGSAGGGDDEMRIITADGRGTALYGPGYFHQLNSEEASVMRGQGVPERKGNAREYDVIRAAAVQGEYAGDPSANG